MKTKLFLFLLFCLSLSCSKQKRATVDPAKPITFECRLEGEVIDRPQSTLLTLIRAGKDTRVNPFISIPVEDGKFSYTLTADENEMYELVFEDELKSGSWMPTYFIAEKGTLHFTLYPMEHRLHSVMQADGALNKEEIRMQKEMEKLYPVTRLEAEIDKLEKEERYYSKEIYDLQKLMEVAET